LWTCILVEAVVQKSIYAAVAATTEGGSLGECVHEGCCVREMGEETVGAEGEEGGGWSE
jgi:hypothetical protein